MGKSFSQFCNKKYWHISGITICNVNKMLTNDIVSFNWPGPGLPFPTSYLTASELHRFNICFILELMISHSLQTSMSVSATLVNMVGRVTIIRDLSPVYVLHSGRVHTVNEVNI